MSTGVEFKSGKTERDENFPVASLLIARRFRAPILAFYRFARAADDAADHPTLSERDKFTLLDALEHTLLGKSDAALDAIPLRGALAETGLAARHPLELLVAFRQDVTKRRYRDWDELMQYCTYSAMPVGRFVLDVHGESQDTWSSSDALCSALQVINHLQDCAKDYRVLDRVYVPLDALDAHGVRVQALAASAASPELRACLTSLVDRTAPLMPEAKELPERVRNARLGLETAVIVRLANVLLSLLRTRDPLSERVHLSPVPTCLVAARAAGGALSRRLMRQLSPYIAARGDAQ
jgi:hydroxysqualene synthase